MSSMYLRHMIFGFVFRRQQAQPVNKKRKREKQVHTKNMTTQCLMNYRPLKAALPRNLPRRLFFLDGVLVKKRQQLPFIFFEMAHLYKIKTGSNYLIVFTFSGLFSGRFHVKYNG